MSLYYMVEYADPPQEKIIQPAGGAREGKS